MKNKKKIYATHILKLIYIGITTFILILIFQRSYYEKNNFLYAIAKTGLAICILDIICTVSEELAIIYKKHRQKVKEQKESTKLEQENKMQKQLQEIYDYQDKKTIYLKEVETAIEEFQKFQKKLNVLHNKKIPLATREKLASVLKKMENILDFLKDDSLKYHSIKYTIKIYIPKFQEITYNYLKLLKTDTIGNIEQEEYQNAVIEFNEYLNDVKLKMSQEDCINLSVSISSLENVLKAEKEKQHNEEKETDNMDN